MATVALVDLLGGTAGGPTPGTARGPFGLWAVDLVHSSLADSRTRLVTGLTAAPNQ